MSRFLRCLLLAASACATLAAPALASGHGPGSGAAQTRVSGPLFPSDAFTVRDRTQRTGLRVDLPRPDCAARPSDCQDIAVLDRLDGFNLQPRLSIPFSGPIDVASVSSADVFLMRAGGHGHGGGRVVGINQVVWDPATNTLHAESDAFLDQATTYALVVTTGVRDASGAPIAAADRHGHGDDDDAIDEARRAGVDRDHVAAATLFTTQSATAVMEKIRRQLDARRPSPARFDLGPGGARTVFPFSAVTGVTFNRQLRTSRAAERDPGPDDRAAGVPRRGRRAGLRLVHVARLRDRGRRDPGRRHADRRASGAVAEHDLLQPDRPQRARAGRRLAGGDLRPRLRRQQELAPVRRRRDAGEGRHRDDRDQRRRPRRSGRAGR